MATVQARHERNDPNAGMQGAYYTVDIAQSDFLDTETINGGRLSPCAANDFATKPTTLAQSLLVSRGQLRFRMMLQNLQIRSNCRIINMVTTYASDAGDSPITDLNFTLIFENADFVPTTGTTIDGSTSTTTKAQFIRDKIAEALNADHTENMSVFDPTGTGNPQQLRNLAVTVAQVMGAEGEIVDVPFRESVNPNKREVQKEKGLDYAE